MSPDFDIYGKATSSLNLKVHFAVTFISNGKIVTSLDKHCLDDLFASQDLTSVTNYEISSGFMKSLE